MLMAIMQRLSPETAQNRYSEKPREIMPFFSGDSLGCLVAAFYRVCATGHHVVPITTGIFGCEFVSSNSIGMGPRAFGVQGLVLQAFWLL